MPRRVSVAEQRRIGQRIASEERAGVKPSQAVAIALGEARRRGVPVPARKRAARRRNPAGVTPYLSTSKTGHLLTKHVERMEYTHAENGLPYRHVFKTGTSARVNDDGSVEIFRPDGKPSWEDYDPMLFLTNPPHRRARRKKNAASRRGRRKNPVHRRTHARARRTNPSHRRGRRKNPVRAVRTLNPTHKRTRRKNAAHRRGRRKNPYSVRHQVYAVNKPKRRRTNAAHRRSRRKNPPISSLPKLDFKHFDFKAVGAYIVKGAQIGVLTFGGRVITGYATALVDLIPGMGNNTAAVEIGLQFVASVVVGVAGAMINPFVGVCLMGGGFEGAIDNFVQTYIPSVSQALQLSAGGAAAAPASGYARRRVGAYAGRRVNGLPLNPAIPGPVQRRGMARVGAYAGNDARSNMANENV